LGTDEFFQSFGRALKWSMLLHTTNLDFQTTRRNAMPDAEKAPQGLIPVPEGTFQLETRISKILLVKSGVQIG
jgi:hypothetical protein